MGGFLGHPDVPRVHVVNSDGDPVIFKIKRTVVEKIPGGKKQVEKEVPLTADEIEAYHIEMDL